MLWHCKLIPEVGSSKADSVLMYDRTFFFFLTSFNLQ